MPVGHPRSRSKAGIQKMPSLSKRGRRLPLLDDIDNAPAQGRDPVRRERFGALFFTMPRPPRPPLAQRYNWYRVCRGRRRLPS
jgi:hypothetical protein